LARLLFADNKQVRRTAVVTEAEGAEFIGIVIVLMTFLPFGVLLTMDMAMLLKHGKRYSRRHLSRRRHSSWL